MANVQLAGINKSFGAVDVLHDVNLEIKDHEFLVLVGPSGCGKSTLLRIISGLEETTEGTVMIGGTDVTDEDPSSRGVAMVFQSYALYPHMTVRENIGFGLRMGGMPKEQVAEKVQEAVRILELGELMERKPKALSGGQRQRVAIGRAIVRDPKVFLFDEPLSNLDAELRVQMRLEIAQLHQRLGATMVYVTHDQVEAMTLADRIVVLRAGYVEQVGTPIELYDNPDNKFVAGFIGSPRMNFINAEVTDVSGKDVSVVLPGFSGAALTVASRDGNATKGDKLSLGIRPEHFVDAKDASAKLPATAQVVEQLGGVSYIYAKGTSGEMVTVEESGHSKVENGTEATFGVDPATVLLFDKDGKRV